MKTKDRARQLASIAILVMIILVATACGGDPKPRTPTEYATHTIAGISFAYPSDWINKSGELVEGIADEGFEEYLSVAGWADTSESATLAVMVFDLAALDIPPLETSQEKQAAAAMFSSQLTQRIDSLNVITDGETQVAGEWALQTQFTGKADEKDSQGYLLTISHDRYMMFLMFLVREENWDTLSPAYDRVRNSIEFDLAG